MGRKGRDDIDFSKTARRSARWYLGRGDHTPWWVYVVGAVVVIIAVLVIGKIFGWDVVAYLAHGY